MKIKTIHSRVLSTAAHPEQASYEEEAGLVVPERFIRDLTRHRHPRRRPPPLRLPLRSFLRARRHRS